MNKNEDINPFTRKLVKIEGRVFDLSGATGTGKTTLIKEKISRINLPKKFFDVDGEYVSLGSKRIDRNINPDLKYHASIFKKEVSQLWETCIVFSEASLFISHHEGDDIYMRELLQSARRRGNWLFFDFHKLSKIPLWQLTYCNYLFLKKTVMETRQQLNKFSPYPEIIEKFTQVMNSSNEFETRLIEPKKLKIKF